MYKHRLVFIGVWLFGVIALLIYPGFEARGLAMGLIIGYWPFAIFGEYTPKITLLSMFILSAIEIGLCAWIVDKRNITEKVWAGLLFAIIAGVSIAYYLNADKFDTYKACQWVTAAENTPELNYEFTRSEFNNINLIPKMIVGGMKGLYLATAFSFLYALGVTVARLILQRHFSSRISVAGVVFVPATSPLRALSRIDIIPGS